CLSDRRQSILPPGLTRTALRNDIQCSARGRNVINLKLVRSVVVRQGGGHNLYSILTISEPDVSREQCLILTHRLKRNYLSGAELLDHKAYVQTDVCSGIKNNIVWTNKPLHCAQHKCFMIKRITQPVAAIAA